MENKRSRKNSKKKKRCDFGQYKVSEKLLYYHDKVWCKPQHDDQELYAMLTLECFASGLKWALILEKEDAFREAFDYFDPEIVAKYDQDKVEELMNNKSIIRNKKKIEAAINNANKFLEIQKEFGTFDDYIWGFTDGEVIDHNLKTFKDMPSKDDLSEKISKDLKKRGFQFVGPVSIYSYLQSIGIINDHFEYCDFR